MSSASTVLSYNSNYVIYFKFTYLEDKKKARAGVVIFIWPVIAVIDQGFFLNHKYRLISDFGRGHLGAEKPNSNLVRKHVFPWM